MRTQYEVAAHMAINAFALRSVSACGAGWMCVLMICLRSDMPTIENVTKEGIFLPSTIFRNSDRKQMGRRRSKWKDRATSADRATLLLQCAKKGECDELEQLLTREWPSLATSVVGNERATDDAEAVAERTAFLQLTHDHNEATALHLAASEGHCAMIRRLLALGSGEIHLSGGRKRYARTPLHEAAINGHAEACRLLIQYGFLVDCHTTRARTPLMYAVKGDHMKVVECLVDEGGAQLNEQNEMGMTPLYIACQEGHEEIARFLITRGAEVNKCNRTGHAPLHEAVAGGFLSITAFLLESGADKQVVDAMGVTVWHEAAGKGLVDMLHLLLRYKVSLAATSGGQDAVDKVMARHPFHYAAVEGKTAFVEAMLATNLVDVNMVDADNCTAIYYAAANGHVDVLKVLLTHGGDPNVASIRRSPLHCAIAWKRVDCAALLVQAGASLDARDRDGCTALDAAVALQDRALLASLGIPHPDH